MPSVIFLDLDGVLNRTRDAPHLRLDDDLVARLRSLVTAALPPLPDAAALLTACSEGRVKVVAEAIEAPQLLRETLRARAEGFLATGLQHGWLEAASALSDDSAPSASLDRPKAQAAPAHPGAPPELLGSSAWLEEPASGRPQS